MLVMFRPSIGDAAVAEDQRLDDQHHRHAERADPRADQDRGERAAEQVAADRPGRSGS